MVSDHEYELDFIDSDDDKVVLARRGAGKASSKAKTKTPTPSTKTRTSKPARTVRPTAIKESWLPPEGQFEAYLQMVRNEEVLFLQVDPRTWIVEVLNLNGGDVKQSFPEKGSKSRLFEKWSLVTASVDSKSEELTYDCNNCPQFRQHRQCVHSLVLKTRAATYATFGRTSDPDAVLFEHDYETKPPAVTTYKSLFSVRDTNRPGSRQRVWVRHIGHAVDDGWECSVCDKKKICTHGKLARDLLRKYLPGIPQTSLDNGEDGVSPPEADWEPPVSFQEMEREIVYKVDERTVSHILVTTPPMFAACPGETVPELYPDYSQLGAIPIGESKAARCRCGTVVEGTTPSRYKQFVVYDTHKAYACTVEVRSCTSCNQTAGPDMGERFIMNFDNNIGVTHRLMNLYDAHFLFTEMTFHGFCKAQAATYQTYGQSFLPEDKFRACWFGFARLQPLDDSFSCPDCAETPDHIIGDGVTVSYQKRRRTNWLTPPTVTCASSPVRNDVKPAGGSATIIQDKKTRTDAFNLTRQSMGTVKQSRPKKRRKLEVNNAWKDNETETDFESETEDSDEGDGRSSRFRGVRKEAEDRANEAKNQVYRSRAEKVSERLNLLSPALGRIFEHFVTFGTETPAERKKREPWRALLLQFVGYKSISTLRNLSKMRDRQSTDPEVFLQLQIARQQVPALGLVLDSCWPREAEPASLEFLRALAISDWLCDRAEEVFERLKTHDATPPDTKMEQPDWKKTGEFYSMPKVRVRPKYPKIPKDGSYERNVVGEDQPDFNCNKYFDMYGKKGYTGGLMALWCEHGYSYGFHSIPEGEGRNDIFSAIYTRWPTAPKAVVYDFACALGPYCMVREADYWKNTVFVVDKFHAKGHKACSQACFLSTYGNQDPTMNRINSSVAEMGNSRLKNIRKSLRYMTEEHAILYVQRFLSLWNKTRRAKLAKKATESSRM